MPCCAAPFRADIGGETLAMSRRFHNPPVMYRAEKGPPVRRDSGWRNLDGARQDVSNTYWASGFVDFSGSAPRVWVEDPSSERAWKGGGRRLVTYLLHPDKFRAGRGRIQSANGMIPNVCRAPAEPIGYGLRVQYDVPVLLSSQPERKQNPRAWFASFGEATGVEPVGTVVIARNGLEVPVYRVIHIHAPGRGPRGAALS